MKIEIGAERRPITQTVNQQLTNEWDGKGLPPVGVECERKWKGQPETHWSKVKILWKNTGKMLIEYTGEHFNSYIQFIVISSTEFRPIRSPEDVARDEAVYDLEHHDSSCESIYDAIAAGKIRGVKLEVK